MRLELIYWVVHPEAVNQVKTTPHPMYGFVQQRTLRVVLQLLMQIDLRTFSILLMSALHIFFALPVFLVS